MTNPNPKPHQLSFELLGQVCSVILDTGYTDSAEDYVKQFYGKPFSELTVCEAEMIIRTLGTKPGCLSETPKKVETVISDEGG